MKVKMRKASITVEAVLVVPLVLMVIFLLLSLTFFVHARSWYTFAAYESIMLAASEGRLSVEKGDLEVEGRVDALLYSEVVSAKAMGESFLGRMFK